MTARIVRLTTALLALAAFACLGSQRSAYAQTFPGTGTLELQSFLTDATNTNTPLTFSVDQNNPSPSPGPQPGAIVVPDNNPALGQLGNGTTIAPVTVAVPGGTLSIFASLSTSTAQPAGSLPALLTSSSVNVQNNSTEAQTITLQVTDKNFTVPTGAILFSDVASGSINPINGNSSVGGAAATVSAFADATNTPFGTGFQSLPAQSFGPAADGAPLFSYNVPLTTSGPFTNPGSYSQTLEISFTLPPNTELTGRQNVQIAIATPEPATFAMAATALPFLGLFWARRRRACA